MTIVEPVKRSLFRRFLNGIIAWENAMDYSSGEYALDRIKLLEREVGQLREELRQFRDEGPAGGRNDGAAGLEH